MAKADELKRPYLVFTLYKLVEKHLTEKERTDVMETPQTIVDPVVARPDYLWWGSTVHIQVGNP